MLWSLQHLQKYPNHYLDNGWDISANAEETRAQNAAEYAEGFKGIEVRSIEGNDFVTCYNTLNEVITKVRKERRPFLVHASMY